MKRFLKKVAAVGITFTVAHLLSDLTRQDPVWYLLWMWLWKDLSETLDKNERDSERRQEDETIQTRLRRVEQTVECIGWRQQKIWRQLKKVLGVLAEERDQ